MNRIILSKRLSSSISRNVKMDSTELKTFTELSSKWYKKELAALQTLNNIRVPWIKDGILSHSNLSTNTELPLSNKKLLDVGCGGGLLTEPLARLGASITGIDTVKENIDFAKARLENFSATDRKKIEPNIEYIHTDVESLIISNNKMEYYDGIIASEVLEHVSDWNIMISHFSQLLKPNGFLFITTINQTTLSYLLAIQLAERCVVPPGTHDWNKFIPPKELSYCLKKNLLHVTMIQGMTMNPLTLRWKWISSTAVNYAMEAVKLSEK